MAAGALITAVVCRGERGGGPIPQGGADGVEVIEAATVFRNRTAGAEARAIAVPRPVALNLSVARACGEVLAFFADAGSLTPSLLDELGGLFGGLKDADAVVADPGGGPLCRFSAGDADPAVPDGVSMLAMRRSLFERLGGFDEDLPPGADELAAMAGGLRRECARSGRARPRSPLVGPESEFLLGAGARTAPVVSVILPAYGWLEWAALPLASLVRQDIGEPYEIIAATDRENGFSAELEGAFPRVRTCFCDPAGGPGGARNEGLRHARGQFVAFTDADCLPDRHWLRTVVGACRSTGKVVTTWCRPVYSRSRVDRAAAAVRGVCGPPKSGPVQGVSAASLCLAAAGIAGSGSGFGVGFYGGEETALLAGLPASARPAMLAADAGVRHLRHEGFLDALRRQYALGKGSGHMRASLRVRGSAFARHRWLIPLLAPARYLLMAVRSLRQGVRPALDFILLSPLILCLLACYAVGFAAGTSGGSEGTAAALRGNRP